jgi:hypothetical protein
MSLTIADVDKRIQDALEALKLESQIVSDIAADADDGTGTATASDGDDYDFEFCAGPFGFRSRPMNGAGGLMLKVGGEGGTAFVIGFRDRQYEIALEKGESAAYGASGCNTKWDKDGNIISTPTGAGKVQHAGTDHPAPKFDLYQDKVNKLLKVLSVIVLSNCDPAGGPLAGTLLAPLDPTLGATNADALAALILALAAVADFQSTKVTNG